MKVEEVSFSSCSSNKFSRIAVFPQIWAIIRPEETRCTVQYFLKTLQILTEQWNQINLNRFNERTIFQISVSFLFQIPISDFSVWFSAWFSTLKFIFSLSKKNSHWRLVVLKSLSENWFLFLSNSFLKSDLFF